MKTPPKHQAALNTEPMALATGSPRKFGFVTKSNFDRRAAPHPKAHRSGRSGFTLIEAMIAITMTLIIMLALAQGFKRLSDDISQGRARLALSDQLRSVSEVLRNDLASLTVDPDPTTPNNKLGYFMYYDGPVTDYTAATLPINSPATALAMLPANANVTDPVPTTEQRLSASKYGDFDDILMFTAKANGDFFKGRVPLAVVKGKAAFQAELINAASQSRAFNFTNVTSLILPSDWSNSVVVASEFAEIAYFMTPLLDPATPINAQDVPNIIDTGSNSSQGLSDYTDTLAGIDLLPNNSGDAIPDRFVLCRRVLLVIPELNISIPSGTSLSGGYTTNGEESLYLSGLAEEQLSADAHNSPTAAQDRRISPFDRSTGDLTAMRNAYQRCDLSVKRTKSSISTGSPVAANSLSDLANPANRFAHTILGTGADTSMPIIALTSPIAIQRYAIRNAVNLMPAANSFARSGFVRPEFLRHKFVLGDHDDDPSTADVSIGAIDGSEFLAMNCIAFDLKGFDPSVRLLNHSGVDTNPVVISVNAVADIPVWGVSGTDDLVLSPSDPAFDQSVAYINIANPPATLRSQFIAAITASTGAFVDIGWGLKSLNCLDPGKNDFLVTPLSGLLSTGSSGTTPYPVTFAPSLLRSGRIIVGSSSGALTNVTIYQPCFDSFTDVFENDGFNQFNALTGTTFLLGRDYLQGTSPPTTLPNGADLAVNGLDDALVDVATAANGIVDDIDERDTSPPFNFAMPAIQATIRLEDKQAGVIQQIAVTQSLVNP